MHAHTHAHTYIHTCPSSSGRGFLSCTQTQSTACHSPVSPPLA